MADFEYDQEMEEGLYRWKKDPRYWGNNQRGYDVVRCKNCGQEYGICSKWVKGDWIRTWTHLESGKTFLPQTEGEEIEKHKKCEREN